MRGGTFRRAVSPHLEARFLNDSAHPIRFGHRGAGYRLSVPDADEVLTKAALLHLAEVVNSTT